MVLLELSIKDWEGWKLSHTDPKEEKEAKRIAHLQRLHLALEATELGQETTLARPMSEKKQAYEAIAARKRQKSALESHNNGTTRKKKRAGEK